MELRPNTYARMASQSGLSLAHGIEVGAGVIDSYFRGEICILLYNHSDKEFHVKEGEKMAQMIIEKISNPFMKIKIPKTVTKRGECSFTSGSASLFTEDTSDEAIFSTQERPIHRLYAMDVTILNIPQEFTVKAILDAGATVCCINSLKIPFEATEKLSYSIHFSGINSR